MNIKNILRYGAAAIVIGGMSYVSYWQGIRDGMKIAPKKERDFQLKMATFENAEEVMVLEKLKENPGTNVYVTADGARMYSMLEDSLVYFVGPDFSDMESAEIEEWIAKAMSHLLFDTEI